MMLLSPGNVGYIRDDFNRTNNASVGSNYRIDSGSDIPQVLSNGAECFTVGNFGGRVGSWADWGPGRLGTNQIISDNYRVRAQLKVSAQPNAAQDNYTGVGMDFPDTFGASTYTVLFVYCLTASLGAGIITQQNAPSSPYYISSGSALNTGIVSRATTTSYTPSATALIELERRMVPGSTTSIFTAFVNGSVFGSPWTDSGSLVGTGPTQRRAGFVIEGNNPNFSMYGGPGIDWWDAFDLIS